MNDQKKNKSGLLTLVALTLMMLAVALSFLAATPSSAEEYNTMCPNGFTPADGSSSPVDRNENDIVCVNDKTKHVIDDNIINYPACWTCHGI